MIEKIDGGTLQVLYAKKLAFKQSSYYLISLEKNNENNRGNAMIKEQSSCLGKLRAIDRHKYILYDNGESYSNQKNVDENVLRVEHAAFLFSYVPCNVGNIRKVTVLLPTVKIVDDDNSTNKLKSIETRSNSDRPSTPDHRGDQLTKKTAISTENSQSAAGTSDNQRRANQLEHDYKVKGSRRIRKPSISVTSTQMKHVSVQIKPRSTFETMLHKYEVGGVKHHNPMYQVFTDKKPHYNAKLSSYAYDFKGRVKEASVKNF